MRLLSSEHCIFQWLKLNFYPAQSKINYLTLNIPRFVRDNCITAIRNS